MERGFKMGMYTRIIYYDVKENEVKITSQENYYTYINPDYDEAITIYLDAYNSNIPQHNKWAKKAFKKYQKKYTK